MIKRLSVPLAKGILLTAGMAIFIGVPIAFLALIAIVGHLPGFWYGIGVGLMSAFAVFCAYVFLY